MKQGRSLVDWASEIERQGQAKQDFVANTTALAVVPVRNGPVVTGVNISIGGDKGIKGGYPINAYTHGQIAARLHIPKPYYDLMLKEQPELLATNVNTWFHEKPERRMVRTLDGRARAFLSDRYRPLDNVDLANAILPEVMQTKGLELASCEITESRLYLKMVHTRLELEIRKGDVVRAGFIIMNSEIGAGRLEVSPFVDRLVCTNGMILTEFGKKRNHIGGRANDEEASELFTDQTLKVSDAAFFMKARDIVRSTLKESTFQLIVNRLKTAADLKIEGDPLKSVEKVANKYALNETEKSSFLKHLIGGGDLTAYGVAQAITRTSQDVEGYDRASELEAIGGEVITLGPSEWKVIADAA